eukprot:1187240-Prorocentrum_minimum.AAC.4
MSAARCTFENTAHRLRETCPGMLSVPPAAGHNRACALPPRLAYQRPPCLLGSLQPISAAAVLAYQVQFGPS